MSYNTDLQNNNTSLQEILATVNSLPEAGGSSGGGAEIETCSLEMKIYQNTASPVMGVFVTTYENGELKGRYISFSSYPTTISNIVCNSLIVIYMVSSNFYSISANITNLKNTEWAGSMLSGKGMRMIAAYQIIAPKNDIATFEIVED